MPWCNISLLPVHVEEGMLIGDSDTHQKTAQVIEKESGEREGQHGAPRTAAGRVDIDPRRGHSVPAAPVEAPVVDVPARCAGVDASELDMGSVSKGVPVLSLLLFGKEGGRSKLTVSHKLNATNQAINKKKSIGNDQKE